MPGISNVRDHMAANGIATYCEIIIDGNIHRFDCGTCNRKLSAWYALHSNGNIIAGAYGCFKCLGEKQITYCSKDIATLSKIEIDKLNEQIAKSKRKHEEEKLKVQQDAAKRASEIYNAAKPATDQHSYLVKKGVCSVEGLRLDKNGSLIVPLRDVDKNITSLQFIDVNGAKRFLSNGKKRNCYFVIGSTTEKVFLCEGLATGITIHQSSNYCTVVCFDAGNLIHVARALKEKLRNRELIITCDNDSYGDRNSGIEAGKEINKELGLRYVVPCFDGLDVSAKPTDFNDLHVLAGIETVKAQIESQLSSYAEQTSLPSNSPHGLNIESDKQSQSALIVGFVEKNVHLFHDKNSYVYAQDIFTLEPRRLDSRQFKDWLVSAFYKQTKKSIRDQSLKEALATLSGLAKFHGECRNVHIRAASYENSYFIDLGEFGTSRAIQIDSTGWKIVDSLTVSFLRSEAMRQLPEPTVGGDLSALWEIINIPESSRLLILAWLCECFRPDTPFPVLELIGEQGSAKSTTQSILRDLIDPNSCNLRVAPKTTEDIFVGAGVNWLISYENISHLSSPMQDALCVLSTGGGFAKRKLYSDADESVIEVKRPVVVNGISASITAQDLVDRTISIETPIIDLRTESTKIWDIFEKEKPKIFGAILDIFSKALKILPYIELPRADRPRLVEFVRLGMAIAEAVGESKEAFLEQFYVSRQESLARTIDASPVASALIDLFKQGDEQSITMPIKDMFAAVEKFKPHSIDSWPRSAKGFGDALRRAAPALRQMDIECRSLGKVGSNVVWVIRKKIPSQSRECRDVVQSDDNSSLFEQKKHPQHDITTCTTLERELFSHGSSNLDDCLVI